MTSTATSLPFATSNSFPAICRGTIPPNDIMTMTAPGRVERIGKKQTGGPEHKVGWQERRKKKKKGKARQANTIQDKPKNRKTSQNQDKTAPTAQHAITNQHKIR